MSPEILRFSGDFFAAMTTDISAAKRMMGNADSIPMGADADSGKPRVGLLVSAVSVVPAGRYLAYQGSPRADIWGTTVDIPRIILTVSGNDEHR